MEGVAKEERRKQKGGCFLKGERRWGHNQWKEQGRWTKKNGKEKERSNREREKMRKRSRQWNWVASKIMACLPQDTIFPPGAKMKMGTKQPRTRTAIGKERKKRVEQIQGSLHLLRSRHEGMQKIIVAGTNGVE